MSTQAELFDTTPPTADEMPPFDPQSDEAINDRWGILYSERDEFTTLVAAWRFEQKLLAVACYEVVELTRDLPALDEACRALGLLP